MEIIKYLSSGGLTPHSISISQQKGELCPQITASFFIDNNLNFSVPETLTVDLQGVSFTGKAHKTSFALNADGKHTAQTTYISATISGVLEGWGQDILYISCPKAQYDAMKFNETNIIIKWKESDMYGNGGWNSKTVIEDIFTVMGEEVTVDVEPIDIGSTTLRYSAGSSIIEFAKSALIGADILGYVFNTDNDGNLTISLPGKTASPASRASDGVSIPAVSLQGNSDHVSSEYTAWKFTGGQAKPILAEYKYIQTEAITEKIEIDKTTTESDRITQKTTSPDGTETNVITVSSTPLGDNVDREVTTKETTRLYDFKGDPFHIVSQIITKTSGIFDENGKNPTEGFVSKEVSTYEYENADPLVYEKSRQKSMTKTTSALSTKYAIGPNALGYARNSKGRAFLLLADDSIKTVEEYDKLWPDVEDIVAGSYTDWINDIITEVELITYTQETDSTRERPEGTLTLNETTKTALCQKFTVSLNGKTKNTVNVRVSDSGETGLKLVVGAIKEVSEEYSGHFSASVTVSPASDVTTSTSRRDIDPITTKGTYKWRITTKTLNFETGKFDIQTQEVTVPGGRIPSEPTQYRKQDILYEHGKMGNAEKVTAFTMSINTNNREHLKMLADLMKGEMSSKTVTEYNISEVDRVYFQGESFNGWPVVGWSAEATAEKESFSVVVKIGGGSM